jgi:hypothetical protein
MELVRRFEQINTCNTVNIGLLQVDRKYPVVRAERVETKYVITILMILRDSPFTTIKVFLPRRYGAIIENEDLNYINFRRVFRNLIFKGKCEKTNSKIMVLEKVEQSYVSDVD